MLRTHLPLTDREVARGVGRAIAVRRVGLGLSQRQLEMRLGLTVRHLTMAENGHRMPRYDKLQAFAGLFKCTVGELIDDGIRIATARRQLVA